MYLLLKHFGTIDLHCFTLCLDQAYIQNLEGSRLKLTQLEQELQRARQQVFCLLQDLNGVTEN
jgi:hypothetical protein